MMSESKDPHDKTVALMFSGGRDSALAFSLMAAQGWKVHLLTFYNGITVNTDLVQYRITELIKQQPNQLVSWKQLPSYGLFKQIAFNDIEQDFKKYQINLICLGCKLAMYTKAIEYSKRNGIPVLATGNTRYQSNWSEQHPAAIAFITKVCERYGIEYINPIYEMVDSETKAKEMLFDTGLSPKALEGSCLFGNTFSIAPEDKILDYLREKIHICEDYLSQRFSVDQPVSIDQS